MNGILQLLSVIAGFPLWIKSVLGVTVILITASVILVVAYYPRSSDDSWSAFRHAWKAGMGYNACVQEFDKMGTVTANIRGLVEQTQPYFDRLEIDVSILEELQKKGALGQLMPLNFKIASTLDAKHGEEVAAMFQIAQNIGPTTGVVKRYISDPTFKKNVKDQGITVHGLTAALGDPIDKQGSFPNELREEWKVLLRVMKLEPSDPETIQKTIERVDEWRATVRQWADP